MIHSNHHREGIPHMTNQDYALNDFDALTRDLLGAAFETNDENGIPA